MRDQKISSGVRVAMLVSVLAFNASEMTVNVQPLVKKQIGGSFQSQPPLMGVPVACLCAGSFAIRPWYQRGDMGMVIISDHDMDQVLETGAEAEPNTRRSHAPEDSIFIGGVCAMDNAPQGYPDNALVLAAGNAYIAVSSEGITISGGLTVDGVSFGSHRHGGVEPGGGTTGSPQ